MASITRFVSPGSLASMDMSMPCLATSTGVAPRRRAANSGRIERQRHLGIDRQFACCQRATQINDSKVFHGVITALGSESSNKLTTPRGWHEHTPTTAGNIST
jgi:hypothetical protein